MLTKEKKIREELLKGKKIYEIKEAQIFRTDKPSKTEPGQALSIRAHVALAQSGIGSLGITDDMFDFDDNVTVDEAIEKSGATLLEPGVSSLCDLVNHRIAMLRREFEQDASDFNEMQVAPVDKTIPPKDEAVDVA